jgi:simple sugar transport system permease protein
VDVLGVLFSAATFASTLRMAVPLLYVSLGGLLAKQAGIENIGLEGMMLIGCFSGFVADYYTGSWLMGLAAACFFTVLISLLFGLFVVNFKSHEIVAGVAVNVLGSALTTYLLRSFFGVKGSFSDPRVVGIPNLDIGIFQNIPYIGQILNGQSVLFWISLPCVALIGYLLYRTRFGYYIRAAGKNAKSLDSAGVNVSLVRYLMLVLHGALIGIGGAYLSIGYLTQYVEDMTAGRGYIAMAAIAFGMAVPKKVLWAVLLFAFVQSFSTRLQTFGLPSYYTNMIPYAITIIVLAVTSYKASRREKLSAS